jgi:hypothetical protein
MRVTKISIAGALLGLSFVAACRGSDNNTTPDAPVVVPGDSSPIDSGGIHIQDVQNDAMAVNTAVELHGVVVTAVDTFGSRTSAFWIEEAAGGERSGVQVFVNTQVDLLTLLHPGDIIDLSGAVKTEFVLKTNGVPTDTSGRTTTELQSPQGGKLTVTKKGTGAVPAPHIIDALALDGMAQADRDAEYEKWEGVLVEVQNVRTRGFPFSFGKAPFPADTFEVDIADNLILESTQVDFAGVDGLTCFASIVGVEDYFFDWLLLPRAADDLVPGTACAALPTTPSTITALQATTPTGAVAIENVYVTGVSSSHTSLWLSANPTAAPNEGAFVFQSSSSAKLDAALVPGVKVNVVGTVSEFNDDMTGGALTEIKPLRITVVTAAPAALTPVTELPAGTPLTAATLLDPANASSFESVLVTLANVKITALGAADGSNGFIATAVQNGTTFGVATDIVHLAAADLACYKTVTGFWSNLEAAGVTTKPNAFGFVVRDLGTKDGTCN